MGYQACLGVRRGHSGVDASRPTKSAHGCPDSITLSTTRRPTAPRGFATESAPGLGLLSMIWPQKAAMPNMPNGVGFEERRVDLVDAADRAALAAVEHPSTGWEALRC